MDKISLESLKGKYWHKLTDNEMKFLIDNRITWGWIMENLKAPDWCLYDEPLESVFGCWSLIDNDIRKQISNEYCKDCEFYLPKRKGV